MSARVRDLIDRFRLEFDSLALTFSAGVTALIGLGYWAAAGRGYDAVEVGRASAVINSAIMLAVVANLGLGGMYERFLAVSGVRSRALLLRGIAMTAGVAMVLGAGFTLVGPERLFDHPAEKLVFPLLVASLSSFALLDQILVGLQRAPIAAGKNILHSVAKLLLAIALVFTASAWSLVFAWIGPALLLVVVYVPLVLGRWTEGGRFAEPAALPPRNELWHYFGGTYGIIVVGSVAPLIVPLVVLQQLGAATNAYFTVAWALFSAVSLLSATVLGPFVAAAAQPGASVLKLARRLLRMLLVITVGGGLFLALCAPWLLLLLGREYSTETTTLLTLMAVSLPLSLPNLMYGALARAVRRLRLAVVLQVLSCVVVVIGTSVGITTVGLAGIGWTYIGLEALVALIVAVPLMRLVRELQAAEAAAAGGTGGAGGPGEVHGVARDRIKASPASQDIAR